MSFNSNNYLKWLDPKNVALKQASYTLSNLCVFAVRDNLGQFIGLTVFEPRSLDAAFFARLKARVKNPAFAACRYYLFAPQFLSHRVDSLLTSNPDVHLEVTYTSFIEIKELHGFFSIRSKLRVVNVDDSPVILKLLKHVFESMGYVEIVAQVSKSTEATSKILSLKPDIVTMDIQMPEKTGVQVVQEVLDKIYVPIIMISSLELEEGSLVFEALNSGAFDYIQKPKADNREEFLENLRERVQAAVEGHKPHMALSRPVRKKAIKVEGQKSNYDKNLIWCIGSSTGGTQALTRIFTSLPAQIPPTLIVQHIPPVFSKAFADSLNELCPFSVTEAKNGDEIKPNHVYIAPGGMQMGVDQKAGKLFISIRDEDPVNRFKPSVDYLFKDIAKIKGLEFVAGILTGMGKDGAQGLLTLKKLGAKTFAQDEASSAVFGMPRVAIEVGAADDVVSLDNIAQLMLTKSLTYQRVA